MIKMILDELDKYDEGLMPNCLCGENGRSRNDKVCGTGKKCFDCGFDRDEHARRISKLRQNGLSRRSPYGTMYLNISKTPK